MVTELRLTKSPRELAYIKTAVQRAENAFRKLQPYIKVGTTEQKIALKFEELLKKEGCKTLPFGVIVASGHMSALPHAQPTTRVIRKGDIVLFDWGGECEGYYSDMTRVVAIKGRHLKKQLGIYSIALEAQERAIRSVKHGAKAADIDSAARDYIKGEGYDKYFGHSTGHGVGLEVHEKPVISWQNKDRVRTGMVFTIEPGIYLPGFGGVRIEDIVAVSAQGAELITTLPRKLKVIEG
jgi:Xaa-Pro aminopeptidase